MDYRLHFRWTISRARDTYGYNVCTLLVDDIKVAACNGGGYDMQGTCLGNWLAEAFADRLRKMAKPFYGLTWHDPNFDPGKAVPENPDNGADKGKTVDQLEAEGKSHGLDRYQQFYKASSELPTGRHTIPQIDGGVGFSSVTNILTAIGGKLAHQTTASSSNHDYYLVTFTD